MSRKVGTLNKPNAALKYELLETLRANGYDPAAAILETRIEVYKQYKQRLKESKSGFGSSGLLATIAQIDISLMEYVYHKLSRSELTGDKGKDLFVTLGQFFVALDAQKKSNASES